MSFHYADEIAGMFMALNEIIIDGYDDFDYLDDIEYVIADYIDNAEERYSIGIIEDHDLYMRFVEECTTLLNEIRIDFVNDGGIITNDMHSLMNAILVILNINN